MIFTILLHVGTLISVFFMYWKDIRDLIVELVLTIRDLVTGRGLRLEERPVRKLGVMIIAASIPTGIIGVLFNDLFESFYTTLIPTAVGLLLTGCLLWFTESRKSGTRGITEMNFRNAFFIGIMQGIAICPGISRSGATLTGGLLTRLDREFAVKFAFLISIPSILGSVVVELPEALKAGIPDGAAGPMIVGIIVAAVSGLVAIKTMIRIVSKKKLSYFSYYTWIVGAAVIIYAIAS